MKAASDLETLRTEAQFRMQQREAKAAKARYLRAQDSTLTLADICRRLGMSQSSLHKALTTTHPLDS